MSEAVNGMTIYQRIGGEAADSVQQCTVSTSASSPIRH